MSFYNEETESAADVQKAEVTYKLAGQLHQLRAPSLKEQLEQKRLQSLAETLRLEELIALLERNPDTQRVLELMGRNNF